jgi:hypothetical protein
MKKLTTLAILSVLFMAVACSKPPVEEKKAAEEAMKAAITAGAEKYSVDDFSSASNVLDEAKAKFTEKKYNESKELYVKAKPMFEKAIQGVDAGKTKMIDENTAMVKDSQKKWKGLQAKVRSKKNMKADMKKQWAGDVKLVNESFASAVKSGETDPITCRQEILKIDSIISKWQNELANEQKAAPKPAKKTVVKKKK